MRDCWIGAAGRATTARARSSSPPARATHFINNASFPSGWVATPEEWAAIASLCRERDLWLLYWARFEAVLFDGRQVIQPAALPGMRERTVTVRAASLELRMIAWRVGWVVCPTAELVNDVSRVQIYNGLTPSSFAQVGVRVGLERVRAAMGSLAAVIAAVALLICAALVAGCSSEPSPTPPPTERVRPDGSIALPGWTPPPVPSGIPVACGGVGFEAVLHGDPDDPRVTWLESIRNAQRIDVIWPAGYSARFSPELEVLDEGGGVAMRGGDPVDGGCVTGDPDVFLVGWP